MTVEMNAKILPYIEEALADFKDTAYPTHDFDDKIGILERAAAYLKAEEKAEADGAIARFCGKIAEFVDALTEKVAADMQPPIAAKKDNTNDNNNAKEIETQDLEGDIFIATKRDVIYEIRGLLESSFPIVNARKDSNLDAYGYDMVFASTLGSINAAMKQYVDIIIGEKAPITRYFTKEKGSSAYIEISDSTTIGKLNEMKIFDLSPAAANAKAKELYGAPYKLRLAFRVQCGFPETSATIPDVLKFDVPNTSIQEGTTVFYNMHFKKLNLFEVTVDVDDDGEVLYSAKTYAQNPSSPAIIVNTVDLGMNDDVSEEVRQRINNIDPGSMFSIQQLFADFNTIELSRSMKFEGITDAASKYVAKEIFDTHKELLKNGKGILCYSVSPNYNASGKNYFAVPKSFKFWVAPFLTNGGVDRENYKLWTLNYLVSCDLNKPVNPKSVSWNWVEKTDSSTVNGVMSMSNTLMKNFAEGIFKEFSESLIVYFVPEVKCSGFCTMTTSYSTNYNCAKVTFDENKHCEASCDITSASEDWLTVEAKFRLQSNYKVDYLMYNSNGSAILENRIDANIYTSLTDGYGSWAKGYAYSNKIKFILKINIDSNGKMKLLPEITAGTPTSDVTNATMISGDFAGFIKNTVTERVNNNISHYSGYFSRKYSEFMTWYIPGDESLLFASPEFSDKTDLTIQTQYAQPK